MNRLYLLLAILLLFLSTTLAQDNDTWLAWLYNPGNGDMIQIDGFGFIQRQVTLPIPRIEDFYPFDVAVSTSGDRVAYVVAGLKTQLFIYDTHIQQTLLSYDLPDMVLDSLRFRSDDSQVFNESDSALAFGMSLEDGSWQILILDLRSDLVSLILRSSSPSVRAADIPDIAGLTPVIRSFDDIGVIFTLIHTEDDNQQTAYGSYRWDTLTNVVEPFAGYQVLDSDYFLPGREIVQVMNPPTGDLPNTLYAFDPVENHLQPFYTQPDRGLATPRFIQNGERILVSGFDAEGNSNFFVVGRNGEYLEDWAAADGQVISSIYGTGEGFAYTVDSRLADGSSSTTLFSVNTLNALNAGTALFTSDTNTSPHLVWLQDNRFRAAVYTPWANLTEDAPRTISDDSGWQVWIYEDRGRAFRLMQTGDILDSVQLILPDSLDDSASQSFPSYISVSHRGDLLAYVFTESGLPTTLEIYDSRNNRVRLNHSLPHDGTTAIPSHTIDRAPHHRLFNENDTALAFGFGLGQVGWQIDVIDVTTDNIPFTLRHDSPAMQGLTTETGFGVVPIIQRYENDLVYFTIQPSGVLQPPYDSFIWDTRADTVNPTLIYGAVETNHFIPTGEIIMSMWDERLPNQTDAFAQGQLNTLHVYDPASLTRFPFYNAPELWLFPPQFIQNGERILVGGSDATGVFNGWFVIRRDGSLEGILPFTQDVWDSVGVADGFLYIPRDETDELQLMFVNTREQLDAGTPVWQRSRSGRPQIAWVDFDVQDVGYIDWVALETPLSVGRVVVADESPPRLRISSKATVRTTGGDSLNVRTGAGREYAITTRLNTGTRVTLIDGPRTIEAERWWKIQTPSGLEGWVIEQVDGIRTLVPDR